MIELFNFLIHIDKYLPLIFSQYGNLTYAVLFLIVFFETGLVFAPFLPGDSLLFISGTFASVGIFNLYFLFIIFSLAAILGDSVNYWIGREIGERFFLKRGWIKKENLDKTNEFYKKYGAKTLILARFIPMVRTVAPFVAGVGKMDYRKFWAFNIIGGISWVIIFLLGGYFLGEIPWVENNLTIVTLIIIFVSILPGVYEFIRHKRSKK